MSDIRDYIFSEIKDAFFSVTLTPERDGILAGVEEARNLANQLGLVWVTTPEEGSELKKGVVFAEFLAKPKQIALAEECMIGAISKASGVATATKRAIDLAEGKVKIVSGAWKKMPSSCKDMIRRSIATGGGHFRICQQPMLYIDKNTIQMFGSVSAAMKAIDTLPAVNKVVQIKGRISSIQEEVLLAVQGGATVLMIDTGNRDDLKACNDLLVSQNLRNLVQVAFAKDIKIQEIPQLLPLGVDILCIGKEIVDAPLLDIKLDVIRR